MRKGEDPNYNSSPFPAHPIFAYSDEIVSLYSSKGLSLFKPHCLGVYLCVLGGFKFLKPPPYHFLGLA